MSNNSFPPGPWALFADDASTDQLLGNLFHVNDLSWECHVGSVCVKESGRFSFGYCLPSMVAAPQELQHCRSAQILVPTPAGHTSSAVRDLVEDPYREMVWPIKTILLQNE